MVYHRVPVGRALISGGQFLGKRWPLLAMTSLGGAVLWSLFKVLDHAGIPAANVAGSLLCGLFSIFWFRRALSAAPVAPVKAASSLSAWSGAAARSAGVGCLIVIALTVPTVALAYARMATQASLPTPADAQAAVNWALPIAAALASPILIRLYLYYAALAAGRRDIGIADAWAWGRGNSLHILALLAVPLLPLTAIAKTVGGYGLPGTLTGAVAMFFLLALAATLLARALSGLLLAPVRAE